MGRTVDTGASGKAGRRLWIASLFVAIVGGGLLLVLGPGTIAWDLGLIPTLVGLVGLSAATVGQARFHRMRRALRTAERRYRRLVEEGPVIVYEWGFGTPGRWRYVSPQVERLLGYPARDFVDDADLWFRLIHDDDREAVLAAEAHSQQIAVGERTEYRMRHRDGHVVWVRDEAIVVTDEGGQPFFRGTLADVSWQKLAEQEIESLNHDLERRVEERTAELHQANLELREAKEQAVRANRVQSEFLSRASHELRTPLNAILGFGQLLQASELGDPEKEAVGHIVDGGRRLLELVNDVLDISAVRAGQLSLSIEPVSISDVVNEVIETVRPATAERSITLSPPVGTPGTFVLGDRQRLRQALAGVALHAIRFERDGGRVSIRWEPVGEGRTTIRVTDTGGGIGSEQVERLFATFETVEGAPPERGPQLGLPLAKALVEAMGGSISVESRPGEGSTVSVELRSAEDPAARLSGVEWGAPTSAESAHTILYIEDNLANVELVQQILGHRPGTTLLRATLGEVGLQLARDDRPDLVLLDLHLPDMGGEEVLSRLRVEPRTEAMPVIVMSSEQRERPTADLHALGIAGFMPKPIDVHAFLELVDRTLAPVRSDPRDDEHASSVSEDLSGGRRRQDSNL
jgi:PAS domain S-box-containing protein